MVRVEGQNYEGMGNTKKSAKVAAATAALDSLAITGILDRRVQELARQCNFPSPFITAFLFLFLKLFIFSKPSSLIGFKIFKFDVVFHVIFLHSPEMIQFISFCRKS